MLAPTLYMVEVKPRSVFMVRAAKARFTRSIRHQMNIRNRNGSRRQATLRTVICSRVSAMVVASSAHLVARYWLNGACAAPGGASGPARKRAYGRAGNATTDAIRVPPAAGGWHPTHLC